MHCRTRLILLLAVLGVAAWLHTGACGGEDFDFRRAHGFYALMEYKDATEAFEKYLADFPKSERADQARLLLAESYYQLKQYPEAATAYACFIKEYPTSPRRTDALLRAAKVNFVIKKPEASLSAAETFLKENRAHLGAAGAPEQLPQQVATALYYAGEASLALKNAAQARTYWEELLKSYPDSKLAPDAGEGLGWIHFDAKEYEQALARFKLTAAAPGHPRAAWSKLMEGRTLAALKKTDDALAAFKAAPGLGGSTKELEAESAMRTAEALAGAERLPDALNAYKRLAGAFPDAAVTLPALGVGALAWMEAQHQAEALALADLYLKIGAAAPDRPAILRLRARALAALSDEAEAVKAAGKAADEAAAITDEKRKAEEHPAALMLLAELSGAGARGADTYKEVVKLYPQTRYGLAARYELARLSGQAGRVDEALAQVQELLDLLAKEADQQKLASLRRDALFAAAEFAFRKPDHKKAEEYLKAYRELAGAADPRADDVERKLAWCRQEAGDAAGAAQVLDAALKAFPKSQYRDEMLYLRATSAAKSGALDEAVKFCEMVVAEFPASSFADDALYDAATMLYKQGKFDAAIAKLNTLLEQKEYAASTLATAGRQLRASALLQSGKNAEALADAEALLAKSTAEDVKPRLPALRLIKALALLAQPGKEAEAETILSELIQAGPPTAPEVRQAQLRRAHLRFDAKRYAQAKEDFAALAANPGQAAAADALDCTLRLALCHKELKETAEAKAVLEKLAQQKLEGVPAFEVPFQLGNLAFEAADHAAAAAQYERALAAATLKDLPAPARSAANLNLAWSLKRMKEPAKAEKAFAEVLKCDPDGQYAAEALYERGRLLDELNRMDEALQTWKELLERKPDSPQAEKALFLRSQKLAQAGRPAEAIPSFESYLAKYPKGPALREVYAGLGECRLQAGENDGAREAFTKALGEKGLDADIDDVAERALLGLAELSMKKGEPLASKKLALRILTERPASAWRDQAYFMAGKCSEQLNEPEKAIGYYRKLLAEHPKSTHADAATERLKALGAPK